MAELYRTSLGTAFVGDAKLLLRDLADESVNLVLTSPPFALQRQKLYGNVQQAEYVEWLLEFCEEVYRVLTPDGSFVLDLGGAYEKGRPVRSLYNYRVLIALCDKLHFHLAEEFFWHNPARLPSPIEWVNKRKIRVKDAVNTIWWLSKTEYPKADARRVLVPYSSRMKKLHEDPERFYRPKVRLSGHDIGNRFATDNGGAIPSNLLQIANTESNSTYLRRCKAAHISGHPARFPSKLPEFFIQFLTEPGDMVLDIFAGSNTTGAAAQKLLRRWAAFELDRDYLAASVFRFLPDTERMQNVIAIYRQLLNAEVVLEIPLAAQMHLAAFGNHA
jgi:site-specific DNA-methyltransferase (cytosine-N4-specific)